MPVLRICGSSNLGVCSLCCSYVRDVSGRSTQPCFIPEFQVCRPSFIRSTASKILSKTSFHFHHFLGQPLLLRCHGCSEDCKTPRSWGRYVKTAAMNFCISRERVALASKKPPVKCEKKAPLSTSKKPQDFYQIHGFISFINPRSFQKRKVETNISLSSHIIPFGPT